MPEETSPHLQHGAQDQRLGSEQGQLPCGSTGTFFLQLSRDGNLHGLGMLNATTASPKPSFEAPWRIGNAMVCRGNAGWATSKSGHPCPCQNCSHGPPAKKTGRGALLNYCPPMTQFVKGMNWLNWLNWTDWPLWWHWLNILFNIHHNTNTIEHIRCSTTSA